MLDVPADLAYVWLGLATASMAVLGTALALPGEAVPSATAAADVVDAVSVGPTGSYGTHPVSGRDVRVGPYRIALRSSAGTAHATFAYGPVVPSFPGSELADVLAGTPPTTVFADRAAFVAAVERARDRRPAWRSAVDRIAVRRVGWGDRRVTIVG